MADLVDTLEQFLLAGFKASVGFVGEELVRRTPKRTGYAAGWMPGINAPPFSPGQPSKARYPLPGNLEWDNALQALELGSNVVLMSPASYIVSIALEGKSPQAPDPIVDPAVEAAIAKLAKWRWDP